MINRFVIITLIIFFIIFAKMLFASQAIGPNELNLNSTENAFHYRLNKNNFKEVGKAKFSVLFWDIYESTLLTTSGNYPITNQQDQLLFEINYLKDISSNELIKRTEQQWRHIGIPVNNYQAYIPELKRIWPDISKGDTLSLIIHNQHSTFYYNQLYIGSINAPEFGQRFIDIWLAKTTSQPTLRTQLLGDTPHD